MSWEILFQAVMDQTGFLCQRSTRQKKHGSRGGVGAWREANAILESHKLKTNYARFAKKKKKKPVG